MAASRSASFRFCCSCCRALLVTSSCSSSNSLRPEPNTCTQMSSFITSHASNSGYSEGKYVQKMAPALVPPPQLGEGSSCRMAPLLFDFGTERHEGPDISTRFCCPTSLWRDGKQKERTKNKTKDVQRADRLQLPNLPPVHLSRDRHQEKEAETKRRSNCYL